MTVVMVEKMAGQMIGPMTGLMTVEMAGVLFLATGAPLVRGGRRLGAETDCWPTSRPVRSITLEPMTEPMPLLMPGRAWQYECK